MTYLSICSQQISVTEVSNTVKKTLFGLMGGLDNTGRVPARLAGSEGEAGGTANSWRAELTPGCPAPSGSEPSALPVFARYFHSAIPVSDVIAWA